MALSYRIALPLLPLLIAGCGAAASPGGPDRIEPPPPPPHESTPVENHEACKLPAEADTELVFGLAPADRADLEAALQRGPVAMRADGCKLVVVSACALRGSAAYTPSGKEAPAEMKGEDELYTAAPFSAGRIAHAAAGAFPLHVTVAVAGKYEFTGATVAPDVVEACKEATHVVTAYGVGAFEVANKVGVVLEKAGDRAACSGKGSAPPATCKELVSLKLMPLGFGKDKGKHDKPAEGGVAKGPIGPPEKPIKLIDGVKNAEEGDEDHALRSPEPLELETGAEERSRGSGGVMGGAGRNACDPADPLCTFSRHGGKD